MPRIASKKRRLTVEYELYSEWRYRAEGFALAWGLALLAALLWLAVQAQ